jgi:hypothetical protein
MLDRMGKATNLKRSGYLQAVEQGTVRDHQMTDTYANRDSSYAREEAEAGFRRPATAERRRPISMHEGIAVWCDCCSCEAEPYWVEIGEEMGIDLGSDYEDSSVDCRRGR